MIHLNTRSVNDQCFINLNSTDNQKINQYQLANYRTMDYTMNPQYWFPSDHIIYDLQGIDTGKGAGMNPDLDSCLQYSEKTNLPNDRLTEKINTERYLDYLISTENFPPNHHLFLVSTSVSDEPQKKFDSQFYIRGVNCRNYCRASDEFFRSLANKNNYSRKKSK